MNGDCSTSGPFNGASRSDPFPRNPPNQYHFSPRFLHTNTLRKWHRWDRNESKSGSISYPPGTINKPATTDNENRVHAIIVICIAIVIDIRYVIKVVCLHHQLLSCCLCCNLWFQPINSIQFKTIIQLEPFSHSAWLPELIDHLIDLIHRLEDHGEEEALPLLLLLLLLKVLLLIMTFPTDNNGDLVTGPGSMRCEGYCRRVQNQSDSAWRPVVRAGCLLCFIAPIPKKVSGISRWLA